MKKSKNLIIIGLIIALAVAAGAYFTMGEGYQGKMAKMNYQKNISSQTGLMDDIIRGIKTIIGNPDGSPTGGACCFEEDGLTVKCQNRDCTKCNSVCK